MEWIPKLVNVLKIPLKILLPAIWIFSGFVLLANDDLLERINLLEWSNSNGFAFGLVFLVSSCLIIVYIIYFVKDKVERCFYKLTYKQKTVKALSRMSDKEIAIILKLYKSNGNTELVDYADPVVKALISSNYIFVGNNGVVELGWDNEMMVKGTLQPFVRHTLQW